MANNNSRIFKQQYLFEHRNTSLLKEVINLALNPFILFYIKKIPVYTNSDIQYTLEEAIQELYPIIKRVITGNAAIEHLTDILSHTSIDDAKVIERIISKDLKCGVSVSTVNSIWAGLIPEYPVMLASKFEQKLIDRLAFPVLIQEKVDGGRFNAIVRNNEVNFFSRSGNIIDIPNDQMKLAFIELGRLFDFPVVFDGELLIAETGWQLMERKKGNGILNKCIRNTVTEKEVVGIRAIIWDYIPEEDFRTGIWNVPVKFRFQTLKQKLAIFGYDYYIKLVETSYVNSFAEAEIIFNDYLEQGKEGIIIKDPNSIWENKRSTKCIKMKAENDVDAEVIGWIEGTGKYIGKMGSLQCRAGSVEFNVGSGFSDKQREEITPFIIGQIIAVKYNTIITDKRTNKKSLFLPIFASFRADKTEADIL